MKIAGYETHPAADVFPLMEADDFESLRSDIEAHGLRLPIVLHDGRILDGRNRLRACESLGLTPPAVEYEGDSPARYVISLNLKRRHLTPSQAAAAAVEMLPVFEEEARGRMAQGGRGGHVATPSDVVGKSRDAVAEQFNVSGRTVQRAKAVKTASPELFDMVKDGSLDVANAEKALGLAEEGREDFADRVRGGCPPGLALKQVQGIISEQEGYDSDEWYTPRKYTDAAREVMGGIDLDPASSPAAQETVGAADYFTKEHDGLSHEWHGRVYLNPPYSQPAATNFADKLIAEYEAGRVTSAVMVQNSGTDTGWFHRTAVAASSCCFVKGRINFLRSDGESSANRYAQVFFYLGPDPDRFNAVFRVFGLCGKLS